MCAAPLLPWYAAPLPPWCAAAAMVCRAAAAMVRRAAAATLPSSCRSLLHLLFSSFIRLPPPFLRPAAPSSKAIASYYTGTVQEFDLFHFTSACGTLWLWSFSENLCKISSKKLEEFLFCCKYFVLSVTAGVKFCNWQCNVRKAMYCNEYFGRASYIFNLFFHVYTKKAVPS